jgi:hypothetical protein
VGRKGRRLEFETKSGRQNKNTRHEDGLLHSSVTVLNHYRFTTAQQLLLHYSVTELNHYTRNTPQQRTVSSESTTREASACFVTCRPYRRSGRRRESRREEQEREEEGGGRRRRLIIRDSS